MLDDNEKLALVERSTRPWVNYRFRLEDPRVLSAAAAATYLLIAPAAFGWTSVALAACVKITQRVGFLAG
jgi:nitroreductase